MSISGGRPDEPRAAASVSTCAQDQPRAAVPTEPASMSGSSTWIVKRPSRKGSELSGCSRSCTPESEPPRPGPLARCRRGWNSSSTRARHRPVNSSPSLGPGLPCDVRADDRGAGRIPSMIAAGERRHGQLRVVREGHVKIRDRGVWSASRRSVSQLSCGTSAGTDGSSAA